jgi:mRNA-degrading endonuclease toxin of MazEF toxin-antitoxin module
MTSRNTLDRSDLVIVPFPFTEGIAGKPRPALVLTGSAYNSRRQDVIIAYVTSQPQTDPFAVSVDDSDMENGRLMAPSWIRVDRIHTIERTLVSRYIGRLSPRKMNEVRSVLRTLLLGRSD